MLNIIQTLLLYLNKTNQQTSIQWKKLHITVCIENFSFNKLIRSHFKLTIPTCYILRRLCNASHNLICISSTSNYKEDEPNTTDITKSMD